MDPARLGELIEWADLPKPSRIRSALLWQKDCYELDRLMAEQLVEAHAESRRAAVWARYFHHAVTGEFANRGFAQFLDVGPGFAPEVDVVRKSQPDAAIVYVDVDPLVVAHGRALYGEGNTEWINADICNTADVLEKVGRCLDYSRPIALSLINVTEFLPDAGSVVSELVAALPVGSALAVAQAASDVRADVMDAVIDAYWCHQITYRPCSRHEFLSYFDGFEIEHAGMEVLPRLWEPCADVYLDEQLLCYAAFGWKRSN